MPNTISVGPVRWDDIPLGELDLPGGTLRLTFGLGSGLARGREGGIWAVGDRGPNLKIDLAVERYGLAHLESLKEIDGAKMMPWLAFGPAIAELRLDGETIHHIRTLRLRDSAGLPISGIPIPAGDQGAVEQVYDLGGAALAPDSCGADTEAIVALSGGGFWVVEEYAPSLIRLDAQGKIMTRWVPQGMEARFAGAPNRVEGVLPAAAAGRRLNRGFEALAISPDERFLYAVVQSPLDRKAGPDHRHVPIWKLCAQTGALQGEYLYAFDTPKSFRRDDEAGRVGWSDLKIGDACMASADTLLILERITQTAKIYAVDLSAWPDLDKRLIFSTDDFPEIGPDLEGMILLSPHELLLVSDNDFGVEGAETAFWKVNLGRPVTAWSD